MCVCVCGGGGGGGKGRRGAYKRDFTVYQLHWNYLLSSAVADGEDGNGWKLKENKTRHSLRT